MPEAVLKIGASPHVVAPRRKPRGLPFSLSRTPFVTPNEARGPSALACLGMTCRDAVPIEVRDASLPLGRTG